MKIPPHVFALIRDAVAPLDTAETRARYEAGDFPRADKVKDINRRHRWDLYWASRINTQVVDSGDWTDAHIETALKKAVPLLSQPTNHKP